MDLLTHFYIDLALVAVSAGGGYYVGQRGITGVKNDLNDIKLDIEKVKALAKSKKVTVVTPIGSTKPTDTVTLTTTPSK